MRWLPLLLDGGLALALTLWLYRDLDFDRFLTDAHFGWIAMLTFTILLVQVVNGWKWRQILYDIRPVRTLGLTGGPLAGYGANVLVAMAGKVPQIDGNLELGLAIA